MWTNWYHLTDDNLNLRWTDSPGVYYIRLVNVKGKPAKVQRLLGPDPEGTLYIGMARRGQHGGLGNRLWGFWTAATGTDETPHGAGKKFRRLLWKHYPKHQLQFCFRRLKGGKQAKRLEEECLRNYQSGAGNGRRSDA